MKLELFHILQFISIRNSNISYDLLFDIRPLILMKNSKIL